ncbi:MAG: GIY-YIG nuclease family protein [Gammaproteobacteria bacterium]|jgi:Uri superfamily endonuclease
MLNQKGTYALILQSNSTRKIQIGRLGKLALNSGYYLYVGSAFGPGGLKSRLDHHLKRAIKPHWHIDYLRRYTKVIEIWYTTDAVRREDDWVTNMTKIPHVNIAYPGFGASDSNSVSHLFWSARNPELESFREVVKKIPNHGPIYVSQR